ncbi:MAG TPA: quinoprotein amine dehydrogenase, beta chain-like protein [Betaproteobacteria bacterium]|nr:quinoprotein amine dehydrogenase, beta chain-like protein [Betaproteobacteria bacterium]
MNPIGQLQATPNFPTQAAVHGQWVAVLSNGASNRQAITLYDRRRLTPLAQLQVFRDKLTSTKGARPTTAHVTRLARQSLFQGLAFGADGTLYAAGGVSDDVLALRYRADTLRVVRRYRLRAQPFPPTQYPYQYQGNQARPRHFYPDSIAVTRRFLYVTGMLSNSLARIELKTGQVRYVNTGPYPCAVIAADQGKRLVVSNWGANDVTVLDSRSLRILGRIPLLPDGNPVEGAPAGVHPTAMQAVPGSARVFVLASNADLLVEIDTQRLKRLRTVSLAPYAKAPPGAYPDAITIAGKRLFVANAGNNDVAILDRNTLQPLGLLPTAWYPTAIATDGQALFVAAAKGVGDGPNLHRQWVGDLMHGALQRIDLAGLPPHFSQLTRRVLENDGFSAPQRRARAAAEAATVQWLRQHIQHVVFILRENKTFDEDLGKYRRAGRWADPRLALYGPRELPNLFHLADRYALFANFFVDGEVTAQAHQWTTAATDSDFVERTWPIYYSNRGMTPNPGWTQSLRPRLRDPLAPYAIYRNLSALRHFSNPWIAYPYRLYLFNDLAAHGVSFANFGEFISRNRHGRVSLSLRRHSDVNYPAWDLDIPESERARRFLSWAKPRLRRGDFPAFTYLWLPNDHTAGLRPCALSPGNYIADNDLATGRIIAALSHSSIWRHTLVILTEDDAQSGADHISAHRSFALMAGPWVKPGTLDTRRYSQIDLLRTIEAIIGIPPMSQWDANAQVIQGVWRTKPDTSPYTAVTPKIAVRYNPGRNCPTHRTPDQATLETLPARHNQYAPTDLLKVAGAEQFRQVWIAQRGPAAYRRVIRYIETLAAQRHIPVSALLASSNAHDDDD